MQTSMHRFGALFLKINALSLRERALIFLAMVAAICAGWDSLVNSSNKKERAQLQQALTEIKMRQDALTRATETVLARDRFDPNVDLHHQLEKWNVKLGALVARKESLAQSFIPPRRMAELLQNLLKEQASLRLVSLATVPAEPLFRTEGKESEQVSTAPMIFRHDLMIEFEGAYFDMLAYLRELERQPLFWDAIEYRVKTYPRASIRLKVYTLSFEREWLGV